MGNSSSGPKTTKPYSQPDGSTKIRVSGNVSSSGKGWYTIRRPK